MTHTQNAARVRALLALAPVLLAGALLTGCSGDGDDTSGDSASSSKPTDPKDKALAFSECMRENGVENFPDPTDGGIKLTPDSGIDMNSDTFTQAQEACRDLSPQGDAGPGGQLDPAKVAVWADCIRAEGLKDFPDPEVKNGAMEIDMSKLGVEPDSDEFQGAMQACRDKSPGGGIIMKGAPK
ncbi:hypothetical protein SRB5_05270 [Streptomyces sp. RB5]|uniref:Lipoprotein n=1 Tax=Streptomyces smaragdinus TaxID=2585196 RepID=A0A7K0CAE9_9ACTN|nr:hypothetical protein [Streptomyces smaragdinus]MQY10419.1 hypothetical protein [Streptomyces smaragdinus]